MKPIRVLHVLGELNRGGAETMVMNIYRKIDRNKVQFDFIIHTTEECDYSEEIRALGGRIFSISKYKVTNHKKYIYEWNQFFENHKEYRIIHGHVRSTASIYLKIATEYQISTIAHSHNTSSGRGLKAMIKNYLQKSITIHSNHLFACSDKAGKWLFGESILVDKRYKVMKNAIDPKKFEYNENIREKIRSQLQLKEDKLIGHIGRFHPQKNHDFLIDVFYELHKLDPKTKLLLVGEGELYTNIKKKVKALNIEKDVIFTGVRNDVHQLLQAIDVFVLPSLYEGLGIVVIEAQAASCNCLVADTLPQDVKITGLVNFMSLQTHKKEWAKKILSISKNDTRISRYSEITESGYNIDKVAEEYQKFYLNEYNINKKV